MTRREDDGCGRSRMVKLTSPSSQAPRRLLPRLGGDSQPSRLGLHPQVLAGCTSSLPSSSSPFRSPFPPTDLSFPLPLSQIFKQIIDSQGNQVEVPDPWLDHANPWEIPRLDNSVEIKFHGEAVRDENRKGAGSWTGGINVLAVPYGTSSGSILHAPDSRLDVFPTFSPVSPFLDFADSLSPHLDIPVPGFKTRSTNNLRAWQARGKVSFDLGKFNAGDYDGAVRESEEAETISTLSLRSPCNLH